MLYDEGAALGSADDSPGGRMEAILFAKIMTSQ
jgi:hypothetical protein